MMNKRRTPQHSQDTVNSDDQAATTSKASAEEQARIREAFRLMAERAWAYLEHQKNNDPRKRWP
jgi:hypothetical protein